MYDSCQEAKRKAEKKFPDVEVEVCVLGPKLDADLQRYCLENLIRAEFPICADDDLVGRYRNSLENGSATHAIRITSDCWQTNPDLLVEIIGLLREGNDYASNTVHRSWLEGLDVQGCSKRALEWFDENQKEKREHPFYFFDQNEIIREEFEKAGFKYAELLNPRAEWVQRSSIDTKEDLERARKIYATYEKARSQIGSIGRQKDDVDSKAFAKL